MQQDVLVSQETHLRLPLARRHRKHLPDALLAQNEEMCYNPPELQTSKGRH